MFHDFHQSWIVELSHALNDRLPKGYSALLERRSWRRQPDLLKPVMESDGQATSSTFRRNRIAILQGLRKLVSVVEIVSPGIKEVRATRERFVETVVGFLEAGIHVMVVDLISSGPSIHNLVWDQFGAGTYELPPGEPMLLASYKAKGSKADDTTEAFIEPLGVGAAIPDMPAFIETDNYVNVPLEETYMRAWDSCPSDMKYLVEHGRLPGE